MLAVCLLILEGEIYSLVLSWSDRFGRENIMEWLPQMKPLQLSGYQSHSFVAQRNFGSYLATDSGWVLHACMTKSVISL